MRKSKYTEEQVAMDLRQAEAGTPVPEICRKLQSTEATFYRWKKNFGGLGVPELRELNQLRDENRRLKLSLRRKKPKRRRAAVERAETAPVIRANERWAMDFMHDSLANGQDDARLHGGGCPCPGMRRAAGRKGVSRRGRSGDPERGGG